MTFLKKDFGNDLDTPSQAGVTGHLQNSVLSITDLQEILAVGLWLMKNHSDRTGSWERNRFEVSHNPGL